MAEPSDLEARVVKLETQVGDLTQRVRRSEHDAAAAHVLAGGADRDVAEIRSEIRDFREQNTRVLNAMREDLTDLRHNMTDLRQQTDNGFIEMRGKLDATVAGQQQIMDLLTTLVDRPGEKDDRR